MNDKQRAFIERITERAYIVFQGDLNKDQRIFMGMFFLQQVKYDIEKIKSLTKAMIEYGVSEDTIECMREAYKAWR